MHSPEVLAFSIVNPWPTVHKQPIGRNNPKWALPIRRRDDGSFYITRFAYVNGMELYFSSLIDIWHMEPGGKDSGTVCKHRITDKDGKFVKWSHAWKWHVWHWKATPVFWYDFVRRYITKCSWCGKKSSKELGPVNHSNGRTVFHRDCSTEQHKAHHAHDPRACYACSGKSSFDYNRDAVAKTLPAINPFMPQPQRAALDGLRVLTGLGLMKQGDAVKTYFEKKKAAEWQ
jgi:hypothetical protein